MNWWPTVTTLICNNDGGIRWLYMGSIFRGLQWEEGHWPIDDHKSFVCIWRFDFFLWKWQYKWAIWNAFFCVLKLCLAQRLIQLNWFQLEMLQEYQPWLRKWAAKSLHCSWNIWGFPWGLGISPKQYGTNAGEDEKKVCRLEEAIFIKRRPNHFDK